MGGGGSAPQFNASQVANQQGSANINTAAANSYLNAINQVTPYGNLTWNQTGTRRIGDGQGGFNEIPEWSVSTQLSPGQQTILDKTQGLQSGALDTANTVLDQVNKTVGQPFTMNQGQFRDQAYDALMSRGQREIDRGRTGERSVLANQGVQAGSEAYRRAMQPYGEQTNDLSNQSFLQAGNLAQQNMDQALTLRNLPIRDLTALLGFGGGVTQPQFANTQQQPIANTDITTPAMQQYQGQLQSYNQQQGANNALMGGLFGLGGSVLGGLARTPKMFGIG